MNLAVFGISHKTASVDIREKYSFSKKQMVDFLIKLSKIDLIDETVLLSTCNRTEIYFVADLLYEVKKIFCEELKIKSDDLKYFYFFENKYAVEHLFCVSSGLDSQILGENQILSQVKQAYYQAKELNTTGKYLNKLFHKAIQVGKLVRQKTEISKGNISFASVSLKLLRSIYGSLNNKKILFIGTGKIVELLVKHFLDSDINCIFVANKNYDKAVELANMVSGKAVRFDKLKDELKDADIVISATSSPHLILKKDMVEEIMKSHKAHLCIVDLAIPRDVAPEVKDIKNVTLFNLDDLNLIIEENYKKRILEAQKAQEIVESEVEKIWLWMRDLMITNNIEELGLVAGQVSWQ